MTAAAGSDRVTDVNRDWRPDVSGVRPSRRPVIRALNSLAEAQRRYAMDRLDRWPIPTPAPPIDLHVSTLACESYAPMLMTMIASFLEHAGQPASMTVISDGSMTPRTAAAVERLWPATEVVEASELLASLPADDPVRRGTRSSPYMVKLAWLREADRGAMPALNVDCDIQFLAGARRLRDLVDSSDPTPRYQHHPPLGQARGTPYDERMTAGVEILTKVNSGVILRRRPLQWDRAIAALEPFAEDPHHLSEQTATAIALTDSGARHFDTGDFVLSSQDLNRPWDSYRRSDAVLRHYASDTLKRKLFVRSTPSGLRSLPLALAAYPFSRG